VKGTVERRLQERRGDEELVGQWGRGGGVGEEGGPRDTETRSYKKKKLGMSNNHICLKVRMLIITDSGIMRANGYFGKFFDFM